MKSSNTAHFGSLQWGRTLSSAESAGFYDGNLGETPASMGPHSFKCGKVHVCVRARKSMIGFNGAALFQVRKALEEDKT